MQDSRRLLKHVDVAVLRASAFAGTIVIWWPDLDDDAAVRRWIAQLWGRPDIAEAVALASPVLAERIHHLLQGHRPTDAQAGRIVLALGRYLVRMRGRATPFGLFAGVAPARIGGHPSVTCTDDDSIRLGVDARWIADMIARLESLPALRRRLLVVRNDLAYVRGDRLVVSWQPHGAGPGPDAAAEVSIRHTIVVEAALQHSGSPIAVFELVDKLAADRPGTPTPALDTMVGELITHGVLITDLRPPGTTTDSLVHLVTRLRRAGADDVADAAVTLAQLRAAQHLLDDAARRTSERRRTRDLTVRLRQTSTSAEQPLAVDLHLATTVVVPHTVAEEAATAAQVLLRLSPAPTGDPSWRAYHGRFLQRYGTGALVPVHDLVGNLGVGFPEHFHRADQRVQVSSRDQSLVALAQQATLDGAVEVVLDASRITELGANIARTPHVDVCVDVRAASTRALAAEDFQIGVCGLGRSGALTGRFLGRLADQRITDAYASLPARTVGAVTAQLSFPPQHPRAENTVCASQVWPTRITLGEHHDPGPGRILVDDLAVMADADRLYLIWMSRRQVVDTTLPHAGARHTMPPLARLLLEIPRAFGPAVTTFDWGAPARLLPFLPRLRYQRTVLSLARWLINPGALPGLHASRTDWTRALLNLRDRLRLPPTVSVGTGDRTLRLHLDNAMDQHLLRAHLQQAKGPTAVHEAPSPADYGWIGGRAHELVIPLARTGPPDAGPALLTRPGPLPVVGADHARRPGSTVLSAQLFGPPELADTIITRHLPDLFTDWPDPPLWWYIRYRHPAPHLRLRLHLPDRGAYGPAVARVAAWAGALHDRGVLADLSVDTYRPEIGRCGTGPALDAAHTVFAADSAAAAAQLRAITAEDAPPAQALTAASLVDLAAGLLGARSAALAWLRHQPDTPTLTNRTVRLHTLRLSDTGMHTMPGGARIATAWQARAAAAAQYATTLTPATTCVTPESVLASLLHLHHVRAHGIDPTVEAQTFRLARAVALADTARRTHGRRP